MRGLVRSLVIVVLAWACSIAPALADGRYLVDLYWDVMRSDGMAFPLGEFTADFVVRDGRMYASPYELQDHENDTNYAVSVPIEGGGPTCKSFRVNGGHREFCLTMAPLSATRFSLDAKVTYLADDPDCQKDGKVCHLQETSLLLTAKNAGGCAAHLNKVKEWLIGNDGTVYTFRLTKRRSENCF